MQKELLWLFFNECGSANQLACKDYIKDNLTLLYPNDVAESSILNLALGYNYIPNYLLNFNSNTVKRGYVPRIRIISSSFYYSPTKSYLTPSLTIYPDLYCDYDNLTNKLSNFIYVNSTNFMQFLNLK